MSLLPAVRGLRWEAGEEGAQVLSAGHPLFPGEAGASFPALPGGGARGQLLAQELKAPCLQWQEVRSDLGLLRARGKVTPITAAQRGARALA